MSEKEGILRMQSSGRWAVCRPGRDPDEITSSIMRAAEDAIEANRKKRPATAPTSERALSFQQQRDAATALRKVAVKAALSVYDTVLIQGRRVGDLWYSELEALRSESAFAASLCDQLIKHARPSKPTRRD